jgi:isopentenyl-diphosphate Delta-isomerase
MTKEIEYVDVIDEEGVVLEVVEKTDAHARGLLHKTVISQVISSSGKWMLIKQAKDRQDAGQYVSPIGGHVKAGERDEDALKREAEEEMGFTGEYKYQYVDRKIYNRHVLGRQENHMFVMYKIFTDMKPTLNEESESHIYFTENEFKKELKENPQNFGDAMMFVVKNFFPHLL